ncbi:MULTISPECIES: arsenic resistance protein [Micrococcaceae]|uniref:arsenic resistance protein n=1 Tax=unclassified Arthrobacter TaxID=235627 RepID=UPI00063D974F|nr:MULTISPECIES: bile acid:sodium symporter [unclassified Arthrobacter]ALQ30784.1 arsenic resistance protein [Arthrobacter sp. YC-RL1]KLI87938.1 arsenic resistance protein [Arthrobacter sp. YC-RL1]RKS22972.1 ACR3 family arsenite efflux pump ArsB [Arthrobacter sp. AG1021]
MLERTNRTFQKWQVPLYLLAVAAAAAFGLMRPQAAAELDSGINPVLGLLLFATFLAIPLTRLVGALRNIRFLLAVVILNFLAVPLVGWLLSRVVAADAELLIGLLLVLLAPCVDYVIVFTRIAGGAGHQLLAATPVLMLLQVVLLPVYLSWFAGGALGEVVTPEPFVHAFTWLIAVPLVSAMLVQLLARRFRSAEVLEDLMDLLMVPLMILVLFLVVASQVSSVKADFSRLLAVVPLYVLFLVIMLPLGKGISRIFKLAVPARRALVFSGATRNSLVVLPLALAMPEPFALVPAVVVAQTIIELLGMLIYVKVVPRLIPEKLGLGSSSNS